MKPLFEILHRDRSSKARTGRLFLPHGSVETPVFMPVGTAGTVKAMNHGELERIGWRLMLSNTYHLYLRVPGLFAGAVPEGPPGRRAIQKPHRRQLPHFDSRIGC